MAVDLGVCRASALRKLDCAFGFGFWVEGERGARKRCGEGVSVGMVEPSSALQRTGY